MPITKKRGRPSKKDKLSDIEVVNYYKLDLKDAKVEQANADGKPRALLVDLEVSSSGRVTNGRIYPPKGHQRGIKSWTTPFAKPVLVHHQEDKDAIGRFTDAVWHSNEDACLDFLGGDYKALAAIKRAFDMNDAKEIYTVMKKYNALSDSWPGLGRVVGSVRITDQDAIEKFLDGRYLTWSAGQTTDSYVCMSCNSDWRKGDFCDHHSGSLDEDGNPVVFLCGTMKGQEVSPVNNPANDTSLTLSMRFADNAHEDMTMSLSFADQLDSAPTIVPKVNVVLENSMNLKDLQALDIETVLSLLSDDAKLGEFVDALKADDHFEISWLVRVHDALHSEWDYQLRYQDPDAPPRMPVSVYRLHGAIHELSYEKDFRGSMINGFLDGYDSEGAPSEEYMIKLPDAKANPIVLNDEQMSALAVALANAMAKAMPAPVKEESNGNEAKEEVKESEEEVLNAAENGDSPAEGSEEGGVHGGSGDPAGEEVDSPSTGTEGASAPAGAELDQTDPGEANGSSDSTEGVSEASDSINWAAVGLALGRLVNDQAKPVEANDEKYTELQADYANALVELESLKDQLATALGKLRKNLEPNFEVEGVKLDSLQEWFTTITTSKPASEPSEKPKQLKPTENPSVNVPKDSVQKNTQVTKTEDKKDKGSKQISRHLQYVLAQYNSLAKVEGLDSANQYLKDMSDFLPSDFDIKDYV